MYYVRGENAGSPVVLELVSLSEFCTPIVTGIGYVPTDSGTSHTGIQHVASNRNKGIL